MDRVLELKNVFKSYGSLKVLKDVSLNVDKGEVVCLLGPSGSGKTTLFQIAARLIKADRGIVNIGEKLRQAYVFQHPRLLPWKTVEENLIFVQENYLTENRAKRIRDILLELNGLAEFKNSYPAQLSGGMKQRLEIIRALSIWPDLLLMDEPFKSIDAQLKFNLREMILRFVEERNLSLLLITHDPEEAVLMADKIYILSGLPGQMIEKFEIDQPPYQRSLHDEKIYSKMEEIIELFMELVDEYRWSKSEETTQLFNKLKK